MTHSIVGPSQGHAARLAGASLLAMAGLAFFAIFSVLSGLVVPGDAAATADAIRASEGLFRGGIVALFLVLVLDVLVAWALYVLLEPVDRSLSLLAAWFRLVYTAIHGVALLNLFLVLQLVDGTAPFAGFTPEGREALASLFVSGHEFGFLVSLVFFGIHLLVLGHLVYRAGYLPRILGVLLFVAGLSYLTDTFAQTLMPDYSDYETFFLIATALPATIGELSLALWLLIRGVAIRTGESSKAVAA